MAPASKGQPLTSCWQEEHQFGHPPPSSHNLHMTHQCILLPTLQMNMNKTEILNQGLSAIVSKLTESECFSSKRKITLIEI